MKANFLNSFFFEEIIERFPGFNVYLRKNQLFKDDYIDEDRKKIMLHILFGYLSNYCADLYKTGLLTEYTELIQYLEKLYLESSPLYDEEANGEGVDNIIAVSFLENIINRFPNVEDYLEFRKQLPEALREQAEKLDKFFGLPKKSLFRKIFRI